MNTLWELTKLCVVRGTWSKTSTSSSSPTSEVESVLQSIRNFLLNRKNSVFSLNEHWIGYQGWDSSNWGWISTAVRHKMTIFISIHAPVSRMQHCIYQSCSDHCNVLIISLKNCSSYIEIMMEQTCTRPLINWTQTWPLQNNNVALKAITRGFPPVFNSVIPNEILLNAIILSWEVYINIHPYQIQCLLYT